VEYSNPTFRIGDRIQLNLGSPNSECDHPFHRAVSHSAIGSSSHVTGLWLLDRQ
jgi:hypothetical protein